jgi:hypothetical protein
MKTFKTLAVTVALYGCASYCSAQNQPFSVTISAKTTTLQVGKTIPILVSTKNVSNQTLPLPIGSDDFNEQGVFEVTVKNADGQPLSRIQLSPEEREKRPKTWSGGTLPFAPGDESKRTFFLNELFDLSVPGKYTVSIRRKEKLTKGFENSNVLTLTITP